MLVRSNRSLPRTPALIVPLFLALLSVDAVALTWPFLNSVTDYDKITGTMGECRKAGAANICDRFHFGTDVLPCGESVKAAASGTAEFHVFTAGRGYWVDIDQTYEYFHLAEHTPGSQAVNAGDEIGISSGTGGVPCHLHFQTRTGPNGSLKNALSLFSISDTSNSSINEIVLRQNSSTHTITDGSATNLSGLVELFARGNDTSNNGNSVNWARIRSQVDGGPYKQDFMFLQYPSGGWPSDPNTVYSNTDPQSTFSPFVPWYQLGRFTLSTGEREICVEGLDYNNKALRQSAENCINITVDTTDPAISTRKTDGTSVPNNGATNETSIVVAATDTLSGLNQFVLTGPTSDSQSASGADTYTHTFSGLTANATYPYTVTVEDVAGNETSSAFMVGCRHFLDGRTV